MESHSTKTISEQQAAGMTQDVARKGVSGRMYHDEKTVEDSYDMGYVQRNKNPQFLVFSKNLNKRGNPEIKLGEIIWRDVRIKMPH